MFRIFLQASLTSFRGIITIIYSPSCIILDPVLRFHPLLTYVCKINQAIKKEIKEKKKRKKKEKERKRGRDVAQLAAIKSHESSGLNEKLVRQIVAWLINNFIRS